MRLSPREQESLLVHQCGCLAQRRLARGVRLNHPEAVALIASQLQEYIRDGLTVSELMSKGREMLGFRQVLPGVPDMIAEVQIEGTFPDGTKLKEDVLVAPLKITPGERIPKDGTIELNKGRKTISLKVVSKCDRPIQVGSHYNFIETNKRLFFDRAWAYGFRLNIPAGTSIRFEPGEERSVDLVEIGGNKIVRGGNGLSDGLVTEENLPLVVQRVQDRGFGNIKQDSVSPGKPMTLTNRQYIYLYGPTVGDRMRLGDTSLILEVEKDFTVYGDELLFGGGKSVREGMGQQGNRPNAQWDVLDTVITNALIVDAVTGIIKADIGLKDGNIAAIGKGGNPDIMDGVTPGMVVGAGTEVIAGEGMIITAGALDAHVHFICPQLAREAIASGITTLFGGGTGPLPEPTRLPARRDQTTSDMLQSTDAFPLNFGFTGKGNSSWSDSLAQDLEEQVIAGAIGLKLHEDWGTTPKAIDTCLKVADKYDVQITIHTDTLNESACVEESIEAFAGRTIHTYHSEGAGGGHAPDIIRVCSEKNVLPSSTNPTRPYTANTIDEHLDMLMVCHHLDKQIKNDVAFAESRIRAETIAAEDILHDMGAISIIASDSQAMGRIGEVICRTWQTADKMKLFRGQLAEETGENDILRIKRYVAKYTINPAIAHGMNSLIGSVEVGKLADLVIWNPAFFGAKPEIIIKGGQIAWSQMGMPNASIPTPEPVKQRKMFGAYGKSVGAHSVAFVSKASVDKVSTYGLSKRPVAVRGCRNLSKLNMVLNDYLPVLTVDPFSYKVHLVRDKDGKEEREHLTCPPSYRLPLAQRYFLF